MTTATVSVISASNSVPNLLFTQTTDQLGKTVFQSTGRSTTLIMNTTNVSVGSNIGYTPSTGVFTLVGNITYEMNASARLLNAPADQAALVWVDTTIGGTVGQPAKFDSVCANNNT